MRLDEYAAKSREHECLGEERRPRRIIEIACRSRRAGRCIVGLGVSVRTLGFLHAASNGIQCVTSRMYFVKTVCL